MSLPEGNSFTRPPLFNGSNYAYWKCRMYNFVQANDFEVWKRIMNGPTMPVTTTGGGATILKRL